MVQFYGWILRLTLLELTNKLDLRMFSWNRTRLNVKGILYFLVSVTNSAFLSFLSPLPPTGPYPAAPIHLISPTPAWSWPPRSLAGSHKGPSNLYGGSAFFTSGFATTPSSTFFQTCVLLSYLLTLIITWVYLFFLNLFFIESSWWKWKSRLKKLA